MYPIALLAIDSIIYLVPIVGIQVIIFSSLTLLAGGYKNVDWPNTIKLILAILPMYLVGVFGLMQFPDFWLLTVTYGFVLFYSVSYIMQWTIKSSPWLNVPLIIVGAYITGLSLSGSPIIAAVALQYLNKQQCARFNVCVLGDFGFNQNRNPLRVRR